MVGGDHEDVVVLLAGLVDLTNGLIGGGNTLKGGLIHTSVANHVRRGEIVHDKVELVLAQALGHLTTNLGSAHLRVQIVGGDPRRGNHITDLTRELLFNTTVEEEGNVGVLLGLGDMALLEVLLAQPLSQDITHVLGSKCDGEGVIGLVLRHGGERDVLGVDDVGKRGTVVVTQELGDFTDTIRAVVEEEESVVVWYELESLMSRCR